MIDAKIGICSWDACVNINGKCSVLGVSGKFIDKMCDMFKEVYLITPTSKKKIERSSYNLNRENIKIIEMPYYEHTIQLIKVIYPTIKSLFSINMSKFDLIYLRIPMASAFMIYIKAKISKKQILIHVVGDVVAQHSKEGSLGIKILKKTTAVAFDLIYRIIIYFTPTITQGKEFKNKYKNKDKKIRELTRFNLETKDIRKYKKKKNKTIVNILWVGHIRPTKNLPDLIEAVSILQSKGIKCFLTVVGGTSNEKYLDELKKKIEKLKLNCIKFTGYIPWGNKLLTYYDNSDMFVFPSSGEGFPRAVLEAMARGLPVITTDAGGLKQLINDKKNGLKIDYNCPVDIANSIKKLVNNEKLKEKIIVNALETARKYTLDNFSINFQKLIKEWYEIK